MYNWELKLDLTWFRLELSCMVQTFENRRTLAFYEIWELWKLMNHVMITWEWLCTTIVKMNEGCLDYDMKFWDVD